MLTTLFAFVAMGTAIVCIGLAGDRIGLQADGQPTSRAICSRYLAAALRKRSD
jgi:hypothetical protein